MRKLVVASAVLIWASAAASSQNPGSTPPPTPPAIDETVPPQSNDYSLGPDSLPHPGVATGKTFTFQITDSKSFPGTVRTITVYVPAEYQSGQPACVYVGLDGLGFRVPVVFDNLISQHAIPVTIAIGVSSGTVNSAKTPQNPRFDRSFEFDSLTDRLPRFLLDEVLPAVEKHATLDGKRIVLSGNPNDRAIGGGSTGAIAAFTVAWERPDAFRRVFTSIGTFVGMRGGEQYNVLVRKTEPKPLRIFMQDGVHDEWPGGPEMGDWWMSNQTMERALSFAGYDLRHIWGAGTHNGKQAESVFPDAMRWLWRDYPVPIEAKEPGNPVLKTVLEPHEEWQIAAEDCSMTASLASNPEGGVFVPDSSARGMFHVEAGKCPSASLAAVLAFGPQGQSYVAQSQSNGIKVYDPAGAPKSIAADLRVRNLTVQNNGDVYATVEGPAGGELWLIRSTGEKVRLDQGLNGPSGIALSPDGLWLFVAQSRSRWGISYRVLADGTVDAKEAFYDFRVPNSADDSGAGTVWMDRTGLAYVATRMGVQIFDRNGRVAAILPLPGNQPATSLCFGGKDFNTLYVLSGGRIYKRKLHSTGAPSWNPPIVLPKPSAG